MLFVSLVSNMLIVKLKYLLSLNMDDFLSFMSDFFLSLLCLSAQTNAISGSEANVMSNKLLSHIDQVHDIGDSMNTHCNLNPKFVEDLMYVAVGQTPA